MDIALSMGGASPGFMGRISLWSSFVDDLRLDLRRPPPIPDDGFASAPGLNHRTFARLGSKRSFGGDFI